MVDQSRKAYVDGEDVIIPLTMGKVAVVDRCDIGLVENHTWTCAKRGDLFYAYRQEWLGNGKMKSILMHRVILGVPDGILVDHIDRDGLNNRRSNIRPCTHGQNMMNRKMPKHNTSGYKGVKLAKSGRWTASIQSKGVMYHLGTFDGPEEAHDEYVRASKKLHVDFSRAM